MRRSWMVVLITLAMLLSLLSIPGTGRAQTSAPGTVVAWGCGGNSNYGQCDIPAGLTGVTAISASGYHNLALKADGTVVAWGQGQNGQADVPPGLSDVIAIAAGPQHNLALKADGTVVAWGGMNETGQISVPAGLNGVIAIAAGGHHNLALKGDGTVVAWGADWYGQSNVPNFLSGVTAIAAGSDSSLALKADGTVVAWGENTFGQSNVPAGLSGVIAIDTGHAHNLALKSDGTVVAWGSNSYGETNVPAGLSGVIAISASSANSLALKADGTVVAWGGNTYGQSNVPDGLSDVTAISAGAFHNLVLISTAVPGPDLAVTQTVDQETVSTGDPVAFTITITNNGDATANIVTLSDSLPIANELDWSIGGTDAANCLMTNGVVSCNFQDMVPGAVKTIRLTSPTQFIYGKGFCPTISSTATVMAYNQPVNKTATAMIRVLCPSVYIDVWPVAMNVSSGDPVGYTVTIGSTGEGIARDVLAEVTLPENPGLSWSIASVVPAGAASNCYYSSGMPSYPHPQLTCSFEEMAPPQEVVVTITSPTISDSCGALVAGGTVTMSNGGGMKGKPSLITVTCPQSVYDNFDDNVTDTSLWFIEIKDSGPTASEANQRLELTVPVDSAGDDFAAWYDSTCQLRGDYDIQVDYELLTWPTANGVRIGLADDHANMQRISSGRQPYDYPGGPELYLTTFDTGEHVVGITSTSDISGKLRLQRVGNTLNSFYYANGVWRPVASYSDPSYIADTSFYVGAWSADPVFADQEVKVAFDNVIVNAGELVCTHTPVPDLAITQVADQATVSTGDPMGFTITVTNNGDGTANNVTLSDTLPVYTELKWAVSGTDAAACVLTAATGALSCNFGDMPPGAVKTIRLASPQYQHIGKCFDPTISSTVTVMADNQPVSRSDTDSIQVLCPLAYAFVSTDIRSVTAGDPISFTYTIENIGDGTARDLELDYVIPNNPGISWTFTDSEPADAASHCAFESGNMLYLNCKFDELASQGTILLTITSPTTTDSCNLVYSQGSLTYSNGVPGKDRGTSIQINCQASHTAQPGEAGTLTLLNGLGQIDFPADLVTVPTTFTYTKQDTPSQDLGSYKFAGTSFTLTAIDSAGSPVTTFPASYTIRLTYQDSDWQDAGITDERLLNLAYWDTASGQWMSLLPCEGCALDTAQNTLVVVLNHLTEFALLAPTDTIPPATSASLSPEVGVSGWYTGPVTVTFTASDSDLGVQTTEYNLNGAGWTIYSVPFEVSTESTSSTVHNTVQYRSTDKAGNVEETKSLTIKIDTTAPAIGASVPLSGYAVQGGIKFGVSLADPLSGPASAMLSIREADGASGKEIGYENLVAAHDVTSDNWGLAQHLDTTQLPDGYYVLVATGKDVGGNEKMEIIPFSVRNWAVLELLPSTENNKAGRTMPVKFSLRVAREVDPDQPFVYSEELRITIYKTGKPTLILQSSNFGSDARDYRIDAAQQTYITNFPTLKTPMQYTVEILRGALSIGTFAFETTK